MSDQDAPYTFMTKTLYIHIQPGHSEYIYDRNILIYIYVCVCVCVCVCVYKQDILYTYMTKTFFIYK